jgi:hypothetical protein
MEFYGIILMQLRTLSSPDPSLFGKEAISTERSVLEGTEYCYNVY